MNDISILSTDELQFICNLKSADQYFKIYFKHSDKFGELSSGRNLDEIPVAEIRSIVIQNKDVPVVTDCLLHYIDSILNSVQIKIQQRTKSRGFETAVCTAISNGHFAKNIDLYLKLAENSYETKYVEQLRKALGKPTENADGALPHSKPSESEPLSTQNYEDTTSERLQSVPKASEQRSQEPANSFVLSASTKVPAATNSAYPFTSLCCVKKPMGSSGELLRLADIVDGVIQTQRRSDAPDRDIIYTQDRSKPERFIGIWNWRVDYNPRSGQENYVTSSYDQWQEPTEVILDPNVETIEELRDHLLHGIEAVPAGKKALFAFFDFGCYRGVLCTEKVLLVQDEKTKLKGDAASLPIYEFSEQEMIGVKGLCFLANINIGTPKSFLRIIDPLEAVKNAVLLRSPIAKLKSWMTIRESREMRTFLQEMPTIDFYQEIADACACSLDEAAAYTDTFVQRAETYLNGDDIESEILESVMNHSSSLLERCRTLNEETWKKEHRTELEAAQEELRQIKADVLQQTEQRAQLTDQLEQVQKYAANLSLEIAQKEKLAADVEAKVAQRINAARKDAAEFISEMAFTTSAVTGPFIPTASASQVLFQPGSSLTTDLIEHQESWDAIRTIWEGLEGAGVGEDYSLEFAAYLYAAYTARIPLLLAGPNGHDIVDALSVALWGKTASILRCEGEYSPKTIEDLLNGDDGKVVAVQNLLHTGWIDHIPELLRMKEKFFVVLHPFAEDLMIEPKGLYNYLLPVLTEPFVDRAASRNFSSGCFCNDFPQCTHAKPQSKLPFVEKLSMPALVQNRLRQILADMKSLHENSGADSDILLGILPYAYVTGKFEVICEELQNRNSLSKKVKELITALGGDLE